MGNQHTAPTIELTAEERQVLEGYVRRRKTAQALATRARIVLRCAEGGHDGIIATQLGVSRGAVGRGRFAVRRLQGLYDDRRQPALVRAEDI